MQHFYMIFIGVFTGRNDALRGNSLQLLHVASSPTAPSPIAIFQERPFPTLRHRYPLYLQNSPARPSHPALGDERCHGKQSNNPMLYELFSKSLAVFPRTQHPAHFPLPHQKRPGDRGTTHGRVARLFSSPRRKPGSRNALKMLDSAFAGMTIKPPSRLALRLPPLRPSRGSGGDNPPRQRSPEGTESLLAPGGTLYNNLFSSLTLVSKYSMRSSKSTTMLAPKSGSSKSWRMRSSFRSL